MGQIYLLDPEELKRWSFEFPMKDLEVKAIEDPKDKDLIGWSVSETIGMGVINPRAISMMTDLGGGGPIKELTEEEKETRRIENKGW